MAYRFLSLKSWLGSYKKLTWLDGGPVWLELLGLLSFSRDE